LKTYLQSIVEELPFEELPLQWQGFDLARFSRDKKLFDFQEQGLQNALKALWLYFKKHQGDKDLFFAQYLANGMEEKLDYDLSKEH